VEGGKTPSLNAADLQALGFSLVIFPGAIVRAVAHTAGEFYASLAANGTSEPFRNRMYDFDGLNDVIGTPAMIKLGQQYESGKKGGGQ
jgi:2-methylisocitrate lyase-like PEP mutase family enzyme